MRLTIVDLSKLTGLDRHTVTSRLARSNIEHEPDSPGNSRQFESTTALPALYNAPLSSVEAVRQRRAELLAAQTERAQYELKKELEGYVTREHHQSALAEMGLRHYEFINQVPGILEMVRPLDEMSAYTLRRALDEYLELCRRHLLQNGITAVTFDALVAGAAPVFERIGTLGQDEVIADADALERFSNAPYGQFTFRFAVNPSRWISYDLAGLDHLRELERQLLALQLAVPLDVKNRIVAAEQGHLPPGHQDVLFGRKNIDGTPTST